MNFRLKENKGTKKQDTYLDPLQYALGHFAGRKRRPLFSHLILFLLVGVIRVVANKRSVPLSALLPTTLLAFLQHSSSPFFVGGKVCGFL